MIVHMLRTEKIPFIQSRASRPVYIMLTIVIMVGIAVPNIPFFQDLLIMTYPPGLFYPYLVGVLFSYLLLCQFVKYFYIRGFGKWL